MIYLGKEPRYTKYSAHFEKPIKWYLDWMKEFDKKIKNSTFTLNIQSNERTEL